MTTKAQSKATVPETKGMEELHCSAEDCNKFIGYARITNGLISIKCHSCKTTNLKFNFTQDTGVLTATEVRCDNCGRFLYLAAVTDGAINVKCRGCGEWNTYLTNPPSSSKINTKVEKPSRSK